MICLNNTDVHAAASFLDILDAMKAAILAYEQGEIYNPDRAHINFGKNTLLTMPCIGQQQFSIKVVSVFPDNSLQKLPAIYGTLLLNDSDTGKPLAILDAKAVTALRTGAVGGLSVQYLVPDSLESLGVIGTGVQGLYQALFACTVRKQVKDVYIFNRSVEKLTIFQQNFNHYFPNIQVHPLQNIRTLVEKSELIITATTSPTPVVPNDAQLLQGKHFLAVGSYRPDMRELPDAICSLVDQVYVDTLHAKEESGDLAIPLQEKRWQDNQISTLASHLRQPAKPNQYAEQTTLFKSVGSAVFDLFAAELMYRNAMAQGIGQVVEW